LTVILASTSMNVSATIAVRGNRSEGATMADIDAQSLAQYRRDGYIIVEGLLDDLTRQRMKQVLAELIEGARAVSVHDDVYDLEPTHSAAAASRAAHQEAAPRASGVRRVHALAAPAGGAERAARARAA
jgi:hypothetical protein